MTTKIIIAGSGGQGIMLLGKTLAMCAMKETKFVTWLPAYGAEVRGGAAHCAVIISDEPIGSPYINKADILIAMNGPSLAKFRPRLKDEGLLLVNSSLVEEKQDRRARILSIPFTEKAVMLGNIKAANMAALGALISATKIISPRTALEVLALICPADKKDLLKVNEQALKEGMRLAKNTAREGTND